MTNKVAVVTGAARRLGAAMAKRLHTRGFNILLHYRGSQEAAESLLAELNGTRANSAVGLNADLLDKDSPKLFVSSLQGNWGRCDLLVNNASAFYAKNLSEYTEHDWDVLMGSNLKAPFFLAQALAPMLIANRGQIINIADINAFKPREHYALYCMAKAGNVMMTKALALELAPDVRVNGIAPGAILWPEDKQGNEIVSPHKLADIPMGKLGGVESICETLDFLVGYSSYITGEVIAVDGGQSVK